MPFQAVEPLRLYRQIAGQIAALIDSGEFPVGSRLPAERELATLLGVSRTSVREAIISLEIGGRVDVRVGTGIFVAGNASRVPDAGDAGPGPFELLAARKLVEGEIAALAAKKPSARPPCRAQRMRRAHGGPSRRLHRARGDRPRLSRGARARHRQRCADPRRRGAVEPARRDVATHAAAFPHPRARRKDVARSCGDPEERCGARPRRRARARCIVILRASSASSSATTKGRSGMRGPAQSASAPRHESKESAGRDARPWL